MHFNAAWNSGSTIYFFFKLWPFPRVGSQMCMQVINNEKAVQMWMSMIILTLYGFNAVHQNQHLWNNIVSWLLQKCDKSMEWKHDQILPQMHARDPHAIKAKASALLFLCSQNDPQILLYPLFHAQHIASLNEVFVNFLRLSLTHKWAQAYLYTLPMEWVSKAPVYRHS